MTSRFRTLYGDIVSMGERDANGCSCFAYSWKLPAYSGAFVLTIVLGAFVLTVGAFLLTDLALLLATLAFVLIVEALLLAVGKASIKHLNGL